jgi:hypothetical protein
MDLKDVAIVSGCRTPMGRISNGRQRHSGLDTSPGYFCWGPFGIGMGSRIAKI